jgi:allantoicase
MTEFLELADLASERLGGRVIAANDEFFAPRESLLRAAAPEWREGEYTDRGKWMDGWETRRRREPGDDWCLIRLGVPGIVRFVVVDTSFFRGNFPEHCSLEACTVAGTPGAAELLDHETSWREILPRTPLLGDSRNLFEIDDAEPATHLRLRIYPDGGVARLRVHGEVTPAWTRAAREGGEVDLAALENGGWVPTCSDMFFGHRQNLILPGPSLFMGDGWETRRRREPGHDWTIVRLAAPGLIHRVELDTDHFKGNAPASFSLEGLHGPDLAAAALTDPAAPWRLLMHETPLQPDARHRFEELLDTRPVTHVRLNIFPDGGVARLRLWGRLDPLPGA